LNEPSPGLIYDARDITVTLPEGAAADFDRKLCTDFYRRMIASIRAVDGDGWFFYEPRVAAPANGQSSFILELEDPREGDPQRRDQLAESAAIARGVGLRPNLAQCRALHARAARHG
jgi:TPR repeat protein